MATNQIKITAAISCKNGRFVFPQIGGVYNFPQARFGGGVPGMVTLNFSMGSPVDEFLDLTELVSPGFLFMQNICPDDMGSIVNRNEVQTVTLNGVTDGTFKLIFDGHPTDDIAFDASAEDVQDALEALDNIAPGDVRVTGSDGGPWTIEFAGQYATYDVPVLESDVTDLGGEEREATIFVVVAGTAPLNEIQRVSLPAATSGGTFTLTIGGETTAAIAYNASDSDVLAALAALSFFPPADVPTVTKVGTYWEIEFVAGYAGVNVPLMTGNGASLTGAGTVTIATTQEGAAGQNEIQSFDYADYPGIETMQWRLGYNPWGLTGWMMNPSAAEVQTQLEGLSEIGTGNVSVTRTGAAGAYVYAIEFVGAKGRLDLDRLYLWFDEGLYAGSHAFTVVQEGSATSIDEIQTVTIGGDPTGGNFTLTFEGQTTAAIAYNASAATVQAALEALSNIDPGEVAVAGDAGGPYTVTFSLGRDVDVMTANAAGLTGGGVYVSTIQSATAAADEQQRIVWGAEAPTGGTFTLTFGAETTGNIAYNANAATVKAALEALTGITTVTVTANSDGWTIEFDNPGEQDVDLLTLDGGNLTFGDQVTIATPQTYVRDNEIAWGPKVSGSLAPVFTLRPGAPVILEILPTTEIGFRPSFDGQRVQVVVFER